MNQRNLEIEEIERLAAYLEDELSEAERMQLETTLASDQVLAAYLDKMKNLKSHHQFLDKEAQLRKVLQTTEGKYFQPAPAAGAFRRRVLISLAAALLLAILSWYVLSDDDSLSSLSAEYLVPPVGLTTLRSEEGAVAAPELTRLSQLYDEGKYAEALALMQGLEAELPADHSSEYFFDLGILQLFAGKPKDALETFAKVKTGHTHDLQWYRGWAYLLADQSDNARAIFEELAAKPNPFQQDALQLLRELR